MLRSKILLLIFLLNSICLKAQTFDTLSNKIYPQIFFIGVTELENLVLVQPNVKKLTKKIENKKELSDVVMVMENIQSFPKTKKKDFRYLVLESNSYILDWSPSHFVHNYIIPIAPEEYLPILYKTWPYPWWGIISSIFSGKKEYYKGYQFESIVHHKFLAVLIHVPLYNQFRSKSQPQKYRFKGDKAEQGIYLKVLIPLAEN